MGVNFTIEYTVDEFLYICTWFHSSVLTNSIMINNTLNQQQYIWIRFISQIIIYRPISIERVMSMSHRNNRVS